MKNSAQQSFTLFHAPRSEHRPELKAILAAALLTTALGCGRQDRDTSGIQPAFGGDPLANGKLSFGYYCSSCHGLDGRGEGPVAPALKTSPADLTTLALRNGGVYPAETTFAYIDGREQVRAHGTREMPVWGNVWGESDGLPVAREIVEQRVNEVVEYLRTIQVADTSATG